MFLEAVLRQVRLNAARTPLAVGSGAAYRNDPLEALHHTEHPTRKEGRLGHLVLIFRTYKSQSWTTVRSGFFSTLYNGHREPKH